MAALQGAVLGHDVRTARDWIGVADLVNSAGWFPDGIVVGRLEGISQELLSRLLRRTFPEAILVLYMDSGGIESARTATTGRAHAWITSAEIPWLSDILGQGRG